MNATKAERLESNLNAMAAKVLAAVPIAEAWTVNEICGELRRQGGNHDLRIVQGTLNGLVDQGLVKETGNTYRRVKPREKVALAPAQAAPAAEPQEAPQAPASAPADTLTKLANLSRSLRDLSAAITVAAADLDDLALEVEERIATASEGDQKLRQLQTLLKSIGV